MKIIIALILALILFSAQAFGTASSANILALNTSSTNVTTSAWVQLSSGTPIPVSTIIIANGTSSIIKVGFGASGSEVARVAIGGTATLHVQLGAVIAANTRVALEAVDATASSGWVTVSLLQ